MVFSELTVGVVLAGVAGGMIGAAIGALPALSLAGITIVVGEAAGGFPGNSGSLGVFEVAAAPLESTGITGAVGLGPVFGPHVAFAGGVAAAAYAGRKETFDTSFRYHQAKQIAKPLPSTPPVLLVGGAFGLFSVLVARVAAGLELPLDPIALAVVLSALVHRLALGYPLLGRLRDLDRSVLDMSPFEDSQYWGDADNETAQGTGGRHVVEPWLPDHYEWQNVAVLGVAVGIGAGYIALATGSVFLAFGITLASLLFLSLGAFSLPVTHHMALPASIAALAVDAEPVVGLVVAGVFGLLAALIGELAQRVLYAHADTHFDPAFVSILVTSLLLAALVTGGVFEAGPVPYPGL
ncbi:MAG: hypothetical protein V5A52_05690 [Halovenus sp.]|uniref:hypothetical protein n=1 Tax=Halovenus amylolytica TaxID=2500550 RepID=UPI000FE40A7D